MEQNQENPYSEHSYGEPVLSSYGAGLGGADNDLIEIPPDPFSHQPYSRRTDPVHVGRRRDEAIQVLLSSSQFAEGISDPDYAATNFVSRLLNISSGLFWQLRHNWPPLLLSGRPC